MAKLRLERFNKMLRLARVKILSVLWDGGSDQEVRWRQLRDA